MNEVFFKKNFILLTAIVLIVSGFLIFANYQVAQASTVIVTDSAGLVAAGIDSSVTRITLGSNITLGADLVLSNSTKTVDLYGYNLTVAGNHLTASSNNSILTNSSSTVSNIPDAAILNGNGQDFTVTHIDFLGTLETANTSPLDHNISFTYGSVAGVITSTNPAKTFNGIALTSAAGITPGTGTTFYWLTITGAVTASNAVTYDHVTFNGAVTVSTNVSIFSFCIFNAAVINSSGNSIYRNPIDSGGTTFNGPLTNIAGNADYIGARFNGSVTNTAGDANYIGAIFNGAVTNTTGNAKYDGATFSSISGPLTINAGSADTDSAPTFWASIFSSTNNTAYIPFSLTTPADDGAVNHLTGGGATDSYVNVDVANGTESVVITATTTSGQIITLTGVYPGSLDDSKNVVVTGTTLNPIYTINTTAPGANVSNSGGNKTFTINVHQADKSDIAYTINVQVAAPISFTPVSNSDTANTDLVLGLVGTSATSSDATIATADTSTNPDFITITSVGEGMATITVTAANGNQMTIAVTVAADGTFTSIAPSPWSPTIAYVTNDAPNLGLVGTSVVSSDTSIATSSIIGGDVVITSVALGTAVITVTAANGNQAIINVNIWANGSFSYGPVKWTAKTNSNTANTDEILGLIGTTAVSSNTAIATTSISGGNIAITSVGVGTTTITVSDGVNDATIAVTVDALGAITIGTITPYSSPALSSDASLISVAEQPITATGTGTQGSPKIASISVANAVHAIYVEDVVAATSATSSLYSDSSFTTTARPLVLVVGDTHAYIKVVAEDDTSAYYDVTITRAAATTYAITDGTITKVSGDTTSTVNIVTSPAEEGSTVTLTVAPKTGMQLQIGTLAATYNDGSLKTLTLSGSGPYTFTMPAYAVMVTATFEAEASSLELPYITSNGQNLYISPVDNSTGILWDSTCTNGGLSCNVTDATSTLDGTTNTATIVSVLGAGNSAAQVCSDLNYGGYTDWYLPAINQLSSMYNASSTVNKGDYSGTWVDFTSGNYWSSTEYDNIKDKYALAVIFSSGPPPVGDLKGQSPDRVRCVRSDPTYAVTDGTMTRVSGDDTSTVNIATSPAVEGATVTLTVAPKTGMQLQTGSLVASYDDGSVKTLTLSGSGPYTFTMPAYAVTVSATFVTIPTCSSIPNAATYNAYPTCGVATCNSGYTLSNGTCVASGGGGGSSFLPVTPTAAPVNGEIPDLAFTINNGSKTTTIPEVNLILNANPASVRGYIVSLDANFTNVGISPYPSTPATFILPSKTGSYTLYLKYYSTTGVYSKLYTQSISLQPIQPMIKLPTNTTISIPTTIPHYLFKRALQLGSKGLDVKALQHFLNVNGYILSKNGAGSLGNETTAFGPATKAALIKFQKANKIYPTAGYFGPITIRAVNTK